jgi:hypothetical protein
MLSFEYMNHVNTYNAKRTALSRTAIEIHGIHKRLVRFQELLKIISRPTRTQHTLSAVETVQVSHALPAFHFS